jgi:hypothetical protein
MLSDAMRLQLMAVRASIDAALQADRSERDAAMSAVELHGGCAHPKERRMSRARMGSPDAALCRECGATTDDGTTWIMPLTEATAALAREG